jgi:hypothetical protein
MDKRKISKRRSSCTNELPVCELTRHSWSDERGEREKAEKARPPLVETVSQLKESTLLCNGS